MYVCINNILYINAAINVHIKHTVALWKGCIFTSAEKNIFSNKYLALLSTCIFNHHFNCVDSLFRMLTRISSSGWRRKVASLMPALSSIIIPFAGGETQELRKLKWLLFPHVSLVFIPTDIFVANMMQTSKLVQANLPAPSLFKNQFRHLR